MEDKSASLPVVQDPVQYTDVIEDYQEKAGYNFAQDGEPSYAQSGIWREEIGAQIDAYTLKSLFFSEDWVFIIVDLVANKIASQNLMVMQKTMASSISAVEPADDHELNNLIHNPNPFQDYSSWMYNMVVELILMGNDILWHQKRNDHLMVLSSENVTLDFNEKHILRKYRYAVGECESPDGYMEFDPKEIIHIRRPNPSSLYWGLSPFVPGKKSLLFNRYSMDYLNAFYLRQATPGMALSLDKQINEDVALRQLRTFELAYAGRKNQRRTMILPKGVTAQPMSHTISDQRLTDIIDKNREVIINLLKIPKHELSLQKVGSLGSEEHRLALRNFWEATLIPAMRLIEGSLTKFFRGQGRLSEEYFLKFNITDVDALQEDKLAKAELAKELLDAGWTVNEVRQELFSKEASSEPDADLPFNMVKLVRNAPSTNTSPEPVEETPPTEETDDKSLVATFNRIKTVAQKQLDQELSSQITPLTSDTLDLFSAMAAATVDVVSEELSKEGQKAKKSLFDKILAAVRELRTQWVDQTKAKLFPTVERGYDFEVNLVSNQQSRRAIEAIRADNTTKRRQVLEGRLKQTFDGLTEARTREVFDVVEDGIKNNRTIGEITRGILEKYAPGTARWKAERIARTEVLTATSLGQWEALQDTKEVIPGMKKMWLTANDERVRDSHDALDSKTIDADAVFGNGLRFPRDPRGPGTEVVNCRCTLVMIPPDNDEVNDGN